MRKMRKLALGGVIALLLALSITVAAQEDLQGVLAMARYFPLDTTLLVAMRTDENFVDQLDALSQITSSPVMQGAGVPPLTVREVFGMGLESIVSDFDTLLAWLGDYAAIGFFNVGSATSDLGTDFYLVAEVENSEGAIAFFEKALPDGFTKTEDGEFTILSSGDEDDGAIAVSKELLLIYPEILGLPLRTKEARLDTNADYLLAVNSLPADTYNILLYADPEILTTGRLIGEAEREIFNESGPAAVGFTILDDRTLVIDTAGLPGASGPMTAAKIDPDFARYIPRDASAVIHAADLSGLYNTIITTANRFAMIDNGTTPDANQQVEQMIAMVGIDLQEDILSWTTGDYALFTRLNVVDLAAGLVENPNVVPDLNGRFDFGLVIEATDAEKAQALAQKLGALITGALAQGTTPGVTVGSDEINGVAVTVISLAAPLAPGNTFNLDITLGASDDVFFTATRPAATSIITGDGTLASNPSYMDAQPFLLTNPTSVWFADGEGLVAGLGGISVLTLGVMGPAVGSTFETIVSELESPPNLGGEATPIPTVTPLPPAAPALALGEFDMAQVAGQLQTAVDAITSSSISSTITEAGVVVVRFAISYRAA